MNISLGKLTHERAVAIFTSTWIILSFIACTYFSFVAFPSALNSDGPDDVELHFFSVDPGGDYGGGSWYLPNREPWRSRYISEANHTDFLFISLCDIIPSHQRPNCDSGRNWSRIPISVFGCSSLEQCTNERIDVTAEDREDFLTGLVTLDGRAMLGSEDPVFSFENPSSWGSLAPFLMFLLTLFLSFKSGRLVGEFLFEPYREQ